LCHDVLILVGVLPPDATKFYYQVCPESIQPFWISSEPFACPWCNLAASQRRPYCASVNSTSPVGLVGSETPLTELVYCVTVAFTMTERADQRICIKAPAHSTSLLQALFGKASHHPGLSVPLQPRFGSLRLPGFLKTKIAVSSEEICECDGHTIHKLNKRHLTADWLAPRESGCSRMHSKVSSDWLPSYIKATRPVLEIFIMAGYFPDSPPKCVIECYMFRPHMPSSDNKMRNLKQKCVAHVWKFLTFSVHIYSYVELCILLRDGGFKAETYGIRWGIVWTFVVSEGSTVSNIKKFIIKTTFFFACRMLLHMSANLIEKYGT
jgi:hypothetical protein